MIAGVRIGPRDTRAWVPVVGDAATDWHCIRVSFATRSSGSQGRTSKELTSHADNDYLSVLYEDGCPRALFDGLIRDFSIGAGLTLGARSLARVNSSRFELYSFWRGYDKLQRTSLRCSEQLIAQHKQQ